MIVSPIAAVQRSADQAKARALADRIVVMEGGVWQQYGSPFALESCPNNLFVGSFSGGTLINVSAA